MKEVDAMLLANLKQKAIKWRKAAEAYEQEETSGSVEDTVDDETLKDNRTIPKPNKEESDNAYFQLMKQCNQQSHLRDDSSPSLLLPAYVPPLQEITVQVKGKVAVENVTAKHYLTSLIKERDEAIMSAQMCRNKVDELRAANRRLYCNMHDKIDTIRNFWRNNIVEGNSRAGMCIKLALQQKEI